jgi:ACR3 family arsenite transporter
LSFKVILANFPAPSAIFQELGILDRLLTPIILVFMVVGVVIGRHAPQIKDALDTVKFNGVSVRE